ncbi:MAG: hypothetical protein ACLPX1_18375 [Steroidobacteraceae bacterium]
MMGAIRDPPPTPVKPTSAPTPKPAAQLTQFNVISTLVVHEPVGYRTDGYGWIPYMKCPIDSVVSHYSDSLAVLRCHYAVGIATICRRPAADGDSARLVSIWALETRLTTSGPVKCYWVESSEQQPRRMVRITLNIKFSAQGI